MWIEPACECGITIKQVGLNGILPAKDPMSSPYWRKIFEDRIIPQFFRFFNREYAYTVVNINHKHRDINQENRRNMVQYRQSIRWELPRASGTGRKRGCKYPENDVFFCWWCILYLNFDPQFRTICDVVLACWKIMKIEDQEVALPAKKCILAKHLGVCLWDLQNHQEWSSETNMWMQPVKGIKYQTRVNIGWLGPEWSGMQQYFLSESRTLAIEPVLSISLLQMWFSLHQKPCKIDGYPLVH